MLNSFAFFGALETGFIYGLVALGVFISFRILDFPDLTVDGSFPLGAAVAATMIVADFNPLVATFCACIAGACAGLITAWLNVRLQILHLLASILTMIALYSINLRIMDGPNKALLGVETLLTPLDNVNIAWLGNLEVAYYIAYPIAFGILVLAIMALLVWFFKTETGLAMRATGSNARMARANGINTNRMILLGMAISNALVALAGALFAQSQGSADVTMGVGVIVIGLASVIGGEALLPKRTLLMWIFACIVGALLYRLVIAVALNGEVLGLKAQDLNLITAILVTLAIVAPNWKSYFKGARA